LSYSLILCPDFLQNKAPPPPENFSKPLLVKSVCRSLALSVQMYILKHNSRALICLHCCPHPHCEKLLQIGCFVAKIFIHAFQTLKTRVNACVYSFYQSYTPTYIYIFIFNILFFSCLFCIHVHFRLLFDRSIKGFVFLSFNINNISFGYSVMFTSSVFLKPMNFNS